MADELAKQGSYSPLPSHNMWAFGLLLFQLLGGQYSEAHLDAIEAGLDVTLAYAQSLSQLGPEAYLSQVCQHVMSVDKLAKQLMSVTVLDASCQPN